MVADIWITLAAPMQVYAKCILAQPAAASCAGRNWSIYGLIKSDRRTRTRPVAADKRVYVLP